MAAVFIPGLNEDFEEQERLECRAVDYFISVGVIPDSCSCPKCGKSMHFNRTEHRWRCSCNSTKVSLRKDSCFEGIKCKFYILLTLIQYWATETLITTTESIMGSIVERKFIGRFYSMLRLVCQFSNLKKLLNMEGLEALAKLLKLMRLY